MILAYFPAAYPDELLYSLLARYHRHSCSTSPKQTLDDLFGDRNVRATADLPGHLGALCRRLPPERRFTPEGLAAGFTLLPYYAAFEPPMVVAQTLAAMIEGHIDGIHLRLGMTAGTVTAPDRLRFCPVCHADALARWGERYWRRTHQLPGVVVCPEHGVPLVGSAVTVGRQHQHLFVAADEDNGADGHPVPRWAADEPCRAMLQIIAGRSAALLDMPVNGVEPVALSACYRAAPIDRRLASAQGRVDQKRLFDAFLTDLAPALAALSLSEDWSWLAAIVRKHRHAFHPLHHVLFGLFLDRVVPVPLARRPLPRRVVATAAFETQLCQLVAQGESLRGTAHALHVDPHTVRRHAQRLGLVTRWKPPADKPPIICEDAGPAIRERWLHLQKEQPELSRTALSRRLPAEHAWLYRHDREWLDFHAPPVKRRHAPQTRVDWSALDSKIAASLQATATAILTETPPVRITLAELERRLGCPGWIGRRRIKLPLTAAMLTDVSEQVEAFRLRRIAWVRTVLMRSEGVAPAWKIRRMASLPDQLSDTLSDALDADTITMTIIDSFAGLGDDLELLWLAGFVEDPERGWMVRAATRGLTTGALSPHLLPIGLLSLLAPGRCFVGGRLSNAALRGGVLPMAIDDVGAGEVVSSDAVPPEMIGIGKHKRGVQKLFRYRWDSMDVLVPSIEIIRYFFIHNKTMANALMRPGGLMELCRPEQTGFHPILHLHFTERMPVRVLKPPFVAEFAWTAVHPEGRRCWDSVAELSAGNPYVLLRPPRIGTSLWTVRAVRLRNTILVLEILNATGRQHPCDQLQYSHPSIRRTVTGINPRIEGAEPGSVAPNRPPREIVDYVVDDREKATRTDVRQSVLPVTAKGSSFDRKIEIVRIPGLSTQEDTRSTEEAGEPRPSPRSADVKDLIQRRQVRVRAGVNEGGFGGKIPPIEFELLEPAAPDYTGSLEPLIAALHQMANLAPDFAIAMALCVLKEGRAFSYAGRHRRPCLVATIRPQARPPMVLLDVDHGDDAALSSMLLTFHRPVPFREMEAPIKALLDRLVTNSGRWDPSVLMPFADACGYVRLPRVLRHQKRMDQAAYHKAWAMRLIDRLGVEV